MNSDENNQVIQANKEEWLKLCEQAAVEPDPERLLALCRQIYVLLEQKEQALKSARG
jgi:hypothetical protein